MLSRHKCEAVQEQAKIILCATSPQERNLPLGGHEPIRMVHIEVPFYHVSLILCNIPNLKKANSTQSNTYQGEPRNFCNESRCHKETMAHFSLVQSQDVEVPVAGCPNTACKWRLFTRQRRGKLTNTRRKIPGDIVLLCAPRIAPLK